MSIKEIQTNKNNDYKITISETKPIDGDDDDDSECYFMINGQKEATLIGTKSNEIITSNPHVTSVLNLAKLIYNRHQYIEVFNSIATGSLCDKVYALHNLIGKKIVADQMNVCDMINGKMYQFSYDDGKIIDVIGKKFIVVSNTKITKNILYYKWCSYT